MFVLVGGVEAGGSSHWAIPLLKMNKSLTACRCTHSPYSCAFKADFDSDYSSELNEGKTVAFYGSVRYGIS